MNETKDLVTPERLAAYRQEHIGRLFLQAHRDFSNRSVAKLHARGHTDLTLTHTALLPHLDLDGTRITTLAERAGMTKQAMGQLVLDLERLGYVTRTPDPADRRATIVNFTPLGWQFLQDAHEIKLELEAEYAAILGEEGLQTLRTALTRLLDRPGQGE